MDMDKGISTVEAEGLMETSAGFIDIIKFGFGTSLISKNISKKIRLYKKHNIKIYLGVTLFEAYIARNMFTEYCNLIRKIYPWIDKEHDHTDTHLNSYQFMDKLSNHLIDNAKYFKSLCE